jgi:hypothetical protein
MVVVVWFFVTTAERTNVLQFDTYRILPATTTTMVDVRVSFVLRSENTALPIVYAIL